MDINDALLDKLAQLSRLSFNEAEKAAIKVDLQRMIGFINKMQEVDTEHIEPLLHISTAKNVLRPDVVEGELKAEKAMQNSSLNDGTFFKVPKVIKK